MKPLHGKNHAWSVDREGIELRAFNRTVKCIDFVLLLLSIKWVTAFQTQYMFGGLPKLLTINVNLTLLDTNALLNDSLMSISLTE